MRLQVILRIQRWAMQLFRVRREYGVKQCSSWCDTCSGPGLQCIEYASLFYGIVIGGSIFVLLILGGIGVFCVIRKRKQKESMLD